MRAEIIIARKGWALFSCTAIFVGMAFMVYGALLYPNTDVNGRFDAWFGGGVMLAILSGALPVTLASLTIRGENIHVRNPIHYWIVPIGRVTDFREDYIIQTDEGISIPVSALRPSLLQVLRGSSRDSRRLRSYLEKSRRMPSNRESKRFFGRSLIRVALFYLMGLLIWTVLWLTLYSG